MMRAPLVAANWKMNGSFSMLDKMLEFLRKNSENTPCQVVICPPHVLLSSLKKAVEGSGIEVGAQNVHSELSGAFTGETSAPLLKECGVKFCIVGHSERRKLFDESDQFIRSKTETLLRNGIRPILCVGESLEQRSSGNHEDVVIDQLRKVLAGFTTEDQSRCVLAYEPIWAIGTGKSASSSQIYEILNFIHEYTHDIFSNVDLSILYGGSVSTSNIKELLSINKCNGFLIGGASLSLDSFELICESI